MHRFIVPALLTIVSSFSLVSAVPSELGLVARQAGFPTCAQKCITDTVATAGNCTTTTDLQCICNDDSLLTEIGNCYLDECPESDRDGAFDAGIQACGEIGESISIPAAVQSQMESMSSGSASAATTDSATAVGDDASESASDNDGSAFQAKLSASLVLLAVARLLV